MQCSVLDSNPQLSKLSIEKLSKQFWRRLNFKKKMSTHKRKLFELKLKEEHKSCRWMSKLLWYEQLNQTNELQFRARLGSELLFRAGKRGRPGFQSIIELEKQSVLKYTCLSILAVCLFSPKWKYIYFGFQQGLCCLESKNRTICERKSAMSSLDPSIIRFYSFNGSTCVLL